MKRLFKILALVLAFSAAVVAESSAQHTVAVTGGTGFATMRPYPAQEMRAIWGTYQAGFSWRYYSLPRFVGCIGIDVDLMQRGYSIVFYPKQSGYKTRKDYKYYTRKLNSIMVPLVWQPHVYLFKNRMRVYLEAAPTFSINLSSKFKNDDGIVAYTLQTNESGGQSIVGYRDDKETNIIKSGKYEFRRERDNRFMYGLRGGAGVDFLIGQYEFGVRAMYDFGYSDVLRNRNIYYSNNLDFQEKTGENPFPLTPQRSPLDNLTISLRFGYRIGKAGFKEWDWKRPNLPRHKEVFKYAL